MIRHILGEKNIKILEIAKISQCTIIAANANLRIPGRIGQARPELLKNIRTVAQNRLADAKIAWLH